MGVYATYAEFTAVYSVNGVSQADITSYWLDHGALRVNEELGGVYTTPFSDNNQTAKDLSIHFAYLGILMRTRKQDDSPELKNYLNKRVSDISCFGKPMMTDSGDPIFADAQERNDAWSDTQANKPIFDLREAREQRIDPDLIDDLWDQDRND